MITKLELGVEAETYVRRELSMGGNYAQMLLSQSLTDGKFTTYYPSSLDPALSVNFAKSVFILYDEKMLSNVRPKIASQINSYLSTRENSYAIFSSLANIGDPFLKTKRDTPNYVSYDERVYYLIPSWDHSEDSILNALKFSASYTSVCGLTSMPLHQDPLQSRQILSIELLTQLAENTEYIFIRAYDWEGYVVWERTKNE